MGNVYFIRSGELVKIGYTTDVIARLAQLQTGSANELHLLAVIERAAPSLERLLHSFFAETRVRGEWFSFTGTLARLVKHIQLGAQPKSTEDVAMYAGFATKLKPDPRDGKVFAEVRTAALSHPEKWAEMRAEFEARGGAYLVAVRAIENRYAKKLQTSETMQ